LAALQCAAAIQESIHGRNANCLPEDQIHLRVGLHLGEVLQRDGDIYGDAVNIASRIEPLAPTDGVCVSRQVYENVANKSGFSFESLGRRELKNVPAPLEVYRLVMSWESGKVQGRSGVLPANRVAVIPFANISPDPNDEFFADGLTEELISKLSQVGGLKVIARTSVMNYKRKGKNASEIGSELGAGTLVEGSVRKSGARIRVSIQIIDSNTEEHRWAANYDRNLDDIFAVQSEIAQKVTESLPGSLLLPAAPHQPGDAKSVEAYTAFMQARELMLQGTGAEPSLRNALGLFEQAVELDPSFARGWVGLADCYAIIGMRGFMPRRESKARAEEALGKAFAINPDLPEAHAEKGLFAWFDDDFATAEAEDKRAVELNPNLADAYENLALLKSSMGALKESIRLLEKARELDPLSPMVHFLGQLYFYSGREDDALKLWTKIERFAPAETYSRMLDYEMTKGRIDGTREMLEKLEKIMPDTVGVVGGRGMLSAMSGDVEQAHQIIDKLEKSYENVSVTPNYIAYIYCILGDLDKAFLWLGKAVEAHSLIPHNIRYSPMFSGLRKDPRYRQLLIRNGLNPENEE
jgi:TolB-like protein/Tfp pilus assembly protein PilF